MKTILKVVLLLLFIYSCHVKNDNNASRITDEKTAIDQTIRNSIGWAKDKDTALLYSVIANDTDYIEVDPGNKIVRGIEDFRKAGKFWLDPRFKAVKYEIWDLKISLSGSGTVAWYYCMLNDINEWDGQPASWMNTRWTGVLEKRDGKWVIVQMHFSFAEELKKGGDS